MRKIIPKIAYLCTLVCLGIAIHSSQTALDRYQMIQFEAKRPVFLPKGEVLKWLSMGYRGLLGDWLWIQSVLYFGRRAVDEEDNYYYIYEQKKKNPEKERSCPDHPNLPDLAETKPEYMDTTLSIPQRLKAMLWDNKSRGLVDYIFPMLDRVTTVDPHFIFPYVFGGVYILMDTGEVDEASSLLEKGYRANPQRWEFPFYLGWIVWMYREDQEHASQYLMEAVSKEQCPKYVGTLLAGLTRKLNKVEMARLYLESLLESTENPQIRKRLEEVLQTLNE
jgi:tetratricopeptide (TPR) repeat protein